MTILLALSLAHATPTTTDSQDVGFTPGFDTEAPAPEGIINGEAATLDQWPEAGALIIGIPYGQGQFYMLGCSSTLIAPDVVLLAAHCIDPAVYQQQGMDITNASMYWSREPNLSQYGGGFATTPPADAVLVRDRVFHEGFSLMGMGLGVSENDDIALLFLDQALTENPMAVLPTPEEAAQIALDAPVSVVGWGQQTSDSQPPPGTVGIKMAGVSHIAEVGTHELKIGEEQTDVRKCHGDSGGPSLLEIETDSLETWRQIGITSHSYDFTDCRETGGVDTRVDAYLTWIDVQMINHCVDGTRVWCDTQGILPPPMPEETEDAAKACGCSSVNGLSSLGLGLFMLPIVARRRR